jgi:hypothetical protein
MRKCSLSPSFLVKSKKKERPLSFTPTRKNNVRSHSRREKKEDEEEDKEGKEG